MSRRIGFCVGWVAWSAGLFAVGDDLHPAQIPKLTYEVSWLGNTFPGGESGWVPQDVQDIFVCPDGTVYTTVGWDEHRGNIAAFRDGQWLQQTAHWRKGGIDRLVGETITANSKFIFFATGKSGQGDHDGAVMGTALARRDRSDIANRALERRVSVGVRIRGVAATEERVFVACADDRIRVFDIELQPVTNWPAPSPGEIAVDGAGRLWVCDLSANVVRCFDAVGRPQPQKISFPPGVIPVDVAISPGQQLLVADAGPRRQVRIYGRLDSTPELESVVGELGGVWSGPVPGRLGRSGLWRRSGSGPLREAI